MFCYFGFDDRGKTVTKFLKAYKEALTKHRNYFENEKICRSWEITKRTKTRICESITYPVLLYRWKCWTVRKQYEKAFLQQKFNTAEELKLMTWEFLIVETTLLDKIIQRRLRVDRHPNNAPHMKCKRKIKTALDKQCKRWLNKTLANVEKSIALGFRNWWCILWFTVGLMRVHCSFLLNQGYKIVNNGKFLLDQSPQHVGIHQRHKVAKTRLFATKEIFICSQCIIIVYRFHEIILQQ